MNILVGTGDGGNDGDNDGDETDADGDDADGAGDIPLRSDAPFAFDCTLWQVAPLPTDPSSKFSVMKIIFIMIMILIVRTMVETVDDKQLLSLVFLRIERDKLPSCQPTLLDEDKE